MKQIYLALIGAMIVMSFIAHELTPKGEDDGRVPLSWVTDPNPQRGPQIEAFNKMFPECRLRLDASNTGMTKILVQSTVGIGPDIFDVYGLEQMNTYVKAGILLDVTDIAKEMGFDRSVTYPAARTTFSVDGRQYGFPCNVNATVIFYNKALFDKHDVPYPSGHWTWDECVEVAKKLTHRKTDGRGYETFGLTRVDWKELLLQFGGSIFSPDLTRCTLDSDESIEAIQFYHDLHFKWHVMPTPSDKLAMSGEGGWGAGDIRWFGNGRIAMIRIGRWGLIQFRKYKGLSLGVCYMPHVRGRRPVAFCRSRSAGVNAKSPRRDQAVKFLKFLASEPYCKLINLGADALPGNKAYGTTEHMHNDRHPEDDEYNHYFIDVLRYGHPLDISPFVNPFVVNRIARREIERILAKDKTPAEAMRDAARKINTEIRKNVAKDATLRVRYDQAIEGGGG